MAMGLQREIIITPSKYVSVDWNITISNPNNSYNPDVLFEKPIGQS
jgi:hypothetical protein